MDKDMAGLDWNAYLPREGTKILTMAGVVIAALIGAGWALFSFGYTRGKDIGQDELATYKIFNTANIPDITSAFTTINKELRDSIKVFDRNKELEAQVASYQKQLAEAAAARAAAEADVQTIRSELDAAKVVEDGLRAKLEKLSGVSRSFTLRSNQSEVLGSNLVIGLTGITTNSVAIIFDNAGKTINVGSTLQAKVNNKDCDLILRRMDYMTETADFQWSCRNSADP